jgi:hypothetical protein
MPENAYSTRSGVHEERRDAMGNTPLVLGQLFLVIAMGAKTVGKTES